MLYEIQFLKSLVATVAIEATALFLVTRFWFNIQRGVVSNASLLFTGILCSFATLPYLWFVLPRLLQPYLLLAVVGELLVFLAEATIYYFVLRIGVKRSLLVSFVCNLASVVGGLLMQ